MDPSARYIESSLALCALRDPIQIIKLGTCMIFSAVCPAGFCVISYPEKHIWVVVLRCREITDL